MARRPARLLRATTAAAATVAVAALAVSGCSVVRTINNVRHAVDGNRAIIKSFTTGLKSGAATAFEATYVTSGGSPTTVTYAVQPPKDVTFRQSADGSASGGSASGGSASGGSASGGSASGGSDSGGNSGGSGDLALISNSTGEYSCTAASASSGWSCQKLDKAESVAQNELVGLYTPAHWVTYLNAFAIAAGFAGDKVSTSTMTVNGFAMNCVDFRAKGVKGLSTICTTKQDILGYVKVAGAASSFEIRSYSASPAAALFQLPAGARLTSS
jgi:hypothetical protein